MTRDQYAQQIQTALGRDLQLPQATILRFCRAEAETAIQLFDDGFDIEFAIKHLRVAAERFFQNSDETLIKTGAF
ncbi:MAG: hypothetical protein JKY24_04500 [Pseudomonadales bacterium]|nr:hypothetical protein [Pseudomonadales bacterium]